MSDRLRILQVSTSSTGGGAERVASDLHEAYLRRGLDATLLVGQANGTPGHVPMENDAYRSSVVRAMVSRLPAATDASSTRVRQFGRAVVEPIRALRHALGRDDFDYPATQRILDVRPDANVLHLHNLHGGYFDLRLLPALSVRLPTVITLHDTWLLSGHCAYSLDCGRWLSGCGRCPYPDTPPAMRRDASHHNWLAKQRIYGASALHLVGCSHWVLEQAERSMLAPAIRSVTLVPNGVNLDVFCPGGQADARSQLGIPTDALVLMFSANGITNPYKDLPTLLAALPRVAAAFTPRAVLLLALGARGPLPGVSDRAVRIIEFTNAREKMAQHLRAADLFVHATRADNHPLTVLEAQACGLPAIVADVGGAGETITAGVTGATYPAGDVDALTAIIIRLLGDDCARLAMSQAAIARRETASTERMTDDYLRVYEQAIGVGA